MPRYEITGCSIDVFGLVEMQTALRKVGAEHVSARQAYGWRNQPLVPTFRAASQAEAEQLCNAARERLRPGSLPALLPHGYAG